MTTVTHPSTVLEQLCAWTSALRYEDIPPEVATKVKLLLLDAMGVAVATAHLGDAQAVVDVAMSLGEGRESVLLGSGERLPATSAALVNAARIHCLDFDDTHMQAIIHSSAFSAGVALALGEALGATGKDVLVAATVGYEAATRLCLASRGEFHRRGLHPPGFFGALASALVAASLMRLDQERTRMAFGIACSTGGGILQGIVEGSDVKFFHPGWAALGGILAARLASRGFTGPRRALEGEFGFYKALTGSTDLPVAEVAADLGKRWETLNIAFKMYATEHGAHYFMESALYLKRKHDIRTEDIEEIQCRVNPFRYHFLFEPADEKYKPPTPRSARFSLPYLIAVRLLLERVGLQAFSRETLNDPAILALARKVTGENAPEIVSFSDLGQVTIRTRDGRTFAHRFTSLRGTPDNPASADDIEAKFRDNVRPALPRDQGETLIRAVERIEEQKSIGKVAALTVPPKRR